MAVESPKTFPEDVVQSIFPSARQISSGEIMTEQEQAEFLTSPNSLEHLMPKPQPTMSFLVDLLRSAFTKKHVTLDEAEAPQILPWASLLRGDGPYSFSIDGKLYSLLLQNELDLSQKLIKDKLEVHTIGEGRLGRTKSDRAKMLPEGKKPKKEYASIGRPKMGQPLRIRINVYYLWALLTNEKEAIMDFVRRRDNPKRRPNHWQILEKKTKLISITETASQRRVRYLEVVSPSRLDAFLDRLLAIKGRRNLREAVIHESAHADAFRNFWGWFMKHITTGEERLEKDAVEKEKKIMGNRKYIDLVDFRVKRSTQEPSS